MLGGGTGYATGRFRLVTFLTKGQRILRIVSNPFDVSANEVADMYQARWQIELFFKQLKQNVTIKHLYLKSEQGAIYQLILTMIATLLTYLVKIELNTNATLFQLKRAINYLRFEPVNRWLDHYRSNG